MKMHLLSVALQASMLWCVLLPGLAHAQLGGTSGTSPSGDPRIKDLIERIGWKYEVDCDGDFKLGFQVEQAGPGQIVYINSNTTHLGQLEIRDVWAPAMLMEQPFEAEMLSNFLQENNDVKVGGWRLIRTRQGYLAAFAVNISAEADAQTLKSVVLAVAFTAHKRKNHAAASGRQGRQGSPSERAPASESTHPSGTRARPQDWPRIAARGFH